MTIKDGLGYSSEIPPEDFFNRLNPVDQDNVRYLLSAIANEAASQIYKGTLIGVGGIITEESPRKDINIVALVTIAQKGDEYMRALKSMGIVKGIVEPIVTNSNGILTITNMRDPAPDREISIMSGFLHDEGQILITPRNGTDIDLIPRNAESLTDYLQHETRAFAILGDF